MKRKGVEWATADAPHGFLLSLWLRKLLSPADFLSHGLHVCVCKEVQIQYMPVVWLYFTKCNSGVSSACEHGCSFPAPLGVQCNVKRHDPLTKLMVMGEGKGWKRIERMKEKVFIWGLSQSVGRSY